MRISHSSVARADLDRAGEGRRGRQVKEVARNTLMVVRGQWGEALVCRGLRLNAGDTDLGHATEGYRVGRDGIVGREIVRLNRDVAASRSVVDRLGHWG